MPRFSLLPLSPLSALSAPLIALALAGCASLSPEQCRQADWYQIGYADGVNGLSGARINDHASACAESGIRPDLNEYLTGRSRGLVSYCQPGNGFALGRAGRQHNAADCAPHLRQAFTDEYWRGSRIHQLESGLNDHRSRIGNNDWQMRRNDERIASIRAELGKPNLSADRRAALLNEFNNLVEQKNALARENLYLSQEAGRLQFQLDHKRREYGH